MKGNIKQISITAKIKLIGSLSAYEHKTIKQIWPCYFSFSIFYWKTQQIQKIILFYAICLEHMRNENIWAFAGCCTNKFTPRIFYHLTNVFNICDEAQN